MNPMFFVIAILGCGDGDTACTEARVAPARYETIAQCHAALPEEIARNTDVPFPTISANCRRMGPVMAQAGGSRPRG